MNKVLQNHQRPTKQLGQMTQESLALGSMLNRFPKMAHMSKGRELSRGSIPHVQTYGAMGIRGNTKNFSGGLALLGIV